DPSNSGLTNWSTPQFMQKGNTPMAIDSSTPPKIAYASKFRELNVTGTLDLAMWDPIHVIFLGDYVKNLGFDKGTVSANYGSDVKRETLGYQIGVSVGYPAVRNPWEWKALFYYKYLESDAVMDAFTDSDFNLGGTNAKGWIAGGDLGLAKNVWLSTRWFSSNEISGVPLSIDVLHLNINARF
ncbi:MAG: putative porin, partial [Geobacteraceae bacterium]|nr:putative porin [Geobacteraceae bacterium]